MKFVVSLVILGIVSTMAHDNSIHFNRFMMNNGLVEHGGAVEEPVEERIERIAEERYLQSRFFYDRLFGRMYDDYPRDVYPVYRPRRILPYRMRWAHPFDYYRDRLFGNREPNRYLDGLRVTPTTFGYLNYRRLY